jgi:hypothetical protein
MIMDVRIHVENIDHLILRFNQFHAPNTNIKIKCRNPSLGLMTKARGCNVASQEEALEWRKVWGNAPSHSQGNSHFGELESRWTFEFSEHNFRGQNSMD